MRTLLNQDKIKLVWNTGKLYEYLTLVESEENQQIPTYFEIWCELPAFGVGLFDL